jgi:hypothetical protein
VQTRRTSRRSGRDKSQETDVPAEKGAEDRRSPATPMLVLLACACLVMAVGCLALWHQDAHDHAVERAREDARSAAQSEAKDLLSYNFRTLDYDLSRAKSEMTPAMARSFDDYWRVFRPSVTGVTDATPTRVEVVLFVKMISVNAAHKEPQVDTSWPRLQMRKVGRKWLIDGPRMTTPPPGSATPATPAPSPSKKAHGKSSGKPSGRTSGKPSSKASAKP